MYTHEFCYWLQGYFELREIEGGLSDKQIGCIKRHINLVKEVSPNKTGKFVPWLEGTLDSYKITIEANQELDPVTSMKLTEMISSKLSECFEHEIDKKYEAEADLNELYNIHKPPKPSNQRPPFNPNKLIKC